MEEKIEQSKIIQEQENSKEQLNNPRQENSYVQENNDREQRIGWRLKLRNLVLKIINKPSDPSQKTEKGMKWFYFLIYIALFANAALILYYSVPTLAGYNQSANTDLAYSYYPALKLVDILYNILLIGVAVLSIISRQYLAHRKVLGIKMLYYIYTVNIVLPIFYVIATSAILKTSIVSSSGVIRRLSLCAIILVLNIIYFKKRKAFFH